MKRLLTLLGVGVMCVAAHAQTDPAYPSSQPASTVINAEVFLDTDPGVGAGTPVVLTPGADITTSASISTASLAGGVHRLFLRSRSSAGHWSLTPAREFLVDYDVVYPSATPVTSNIVRAEYFIDVDPGQGLGTPITVTPSANIASLSVSINTGSLISGLHRVFVRTQNTSGQWSAAEVREFAITQDYAYPPAAPQTLSPVVRAEYFIDTDPGYGLGTAIPVTAGTNLSSVTASINTTGLPIGLHRVMLRTQDAAGSWTATAVHELLVTDDFAYPSAPPSAGNVLAAEYFIDTDPGFGAATPVALTPGTDIANASVSINTAGLSPGQHTLYVRSRQNPWSMAIAQPFSVSSPLAISLTRFDAEERGRTALLTWETASEDGLHHLDVERSADGRAWINIGVVAARGNHVYSFVDEAPFTDQSYYRLKIAEKSGGFEYSKVQRLDFRSVSETIELRPNPVSSQLFVDGLEAGARLEVWSTAGALVARFTADEASRGYDVNALVPGMYLLRISTFGADAKTLRFVKQ